MLKSNVSTKTGPRPVRAKKGCTEGKIQGKIRGRERTQELRGDKRLGKKEW